MLAETPILPAPQEPSQRWGSVLWAGLAIYTVAGFAGLCGGAFLMIGLGIWAGGPDIISNFEDIHPQLSAEMQALLSKDGLSLCGILFAVPVGILSLLAMVPRPRPQVRETWG